jgi:dTDP-4-amino-4,6-dideoxygalactose transaminase
MFAQALQFFGSRHYPFVAMGRHVQIHCTTIIIDDGCVAARRSQISTKNQLHLQRDVMNYLKTVGIGTGFHYPIPLHLQKGYASLNYRAGNLPVTERVAAEIVSLPMLPQLTADQQVRVVEEILALLPRPLVSRRKAKTVC